MSFSLLGKKKISFPTIFSIAIEMDTEKTVTCNCFGIQRCDLLIIPAIMMANHEYL